ncbi:MAG TPA: TraR/DksA C4-type zinc finger protein [Opitutales bacterium]|nr:TraR/DksA C4-type zinc finger protein [Opitutales bacterium]
MSEKPEKAAPTAKPAAKSVKPAVEVKPAAQKPARAATANPSKAAEKPAARVVEKAVAPKSPKPVKEAAAAREEKPVKAPAPRKTARAGDEEKPAKGKAPAKSADGNQSTSAALKEIVERKASASTRSQAKSVRKTTVAVFTMDDVRDVLKNRRDEAREEAQKREAAARKSVTTVIPENVPQQTRVLGAATLADILGFGTRPAARVEEPVSTKREIPDRFQKYHDMLLALRDKIQGKINQRSRVANPADSNAELAVPAQTDDDDTFDHDFALSLVANEQDALQEIDSALDRIYDGTYGICEITGREISAERLEAVPFARYSVEGQAQFEMQNRRRAQRTTTFLDSADDAGSFAGEEADE